MADPIVIATRQSQLALWQANFIADQLRAATGRDVELLGITTKGDRWLQGPLQDLGGKGLFIKELEVALMEKRADLAVHSMKDLPAEMPDGFELGCIGFREDPTDALVAKPGVTLANLPAGAVIGTSSVRRIAQLKSHRPDLQTRLIRGNVDSRLQKFDAGEYDAIILATAGLTRLGLQERISQRLPLAEFLPSPGQAALGIECLADHGDMLSVLQQLQDPLVAACVRAERLVAAALGADCSMPLGVHMSRLDAESDEAKEDHSDGRLHLAAMVADAQDGRRIDASAIGSNSEAMAQQVASELIADGAKDLLP